MREHEAHEQFLRLFTASEGRIRAFVRRLVPSRADADDVMQEVAIVLFRKFSEFRQDGNFLAWSLGVARFQVLSWRRDKARDRQLLSEKMIDVLAEESTQDDAQLALQRKFLASCLERLGEKHRDLLLAAYAPDNVIQEVARLSGRTIGGFYQWLHRTKRRLLDCVRDEMRKAMASPAPGMAVDPAWPRQEFGS